MAELPKGEDDTSSKDKTTSVTCKLSRICEHQVVIDEISRTVKILQQVRLEASHLVNVHLLRCLESNSPLPTLDQTFFARCCSAVLAETERSDSTREANEHATREREHAIMDRELTLARKQPRTIRQCAIAAGDLQAESRELPHKIVTSQAFPSSLRATISQYRSERAKLSGYRPPSLGTKSHTVDELAREMTISAHAMLKHQFRTRLHQYIRFRYAPAGKLQLSFKSTNKLVSSCYDAKVEDNGSVVWNPTTVAEQLALRDWLERVPWKSVIEITEGHFLHKLFDMLSWMETFADTHPNTRGTKLYTLLPLSTTYNAGYMRISCSTLREICCRILKRTGENVLNFIVGPRGSIRQKAVTMDHLKQLFDVSAFENEHRKFATSLKTEGYGVSITMTKKNANGGDPDPYHIPDGFSPSVVIGLDPGIRSLATAVSMGQLPCRHRK